MKSRACFIIALAVLVLGATALSAFPVSASMPVTGLYGQYWQDTFFGAYLPPYPGWGPDYSMPIVPTTAPTVEQIDAQIDFGTTSGWDWRPLGYVEFSVKWSGMIHADVGGTYWFRLTSDDGSWLFVDNTLIINNGGVHAPSTVDGSVYLAYGGHWIIIDYYETADSQCGIDFYWKQPGETEWTIVPTEYLINPVKLPNIAPGVPEFSLAVPLVTSLSTVIYLAIRKRIGKNPE